MFMFMFISHFLFVFHFWGYNCFMVQNKQPFFYQDSNLIFNLQSSDLLSLIFLSSSVTKSSVLEQLGLNPQVAGSISAHCSVTTFQEPSNKLGIKGMIKKPSPLNGTIVKYWIIFEVSQLYPRVLISQRYKDLFTYK